MRRFFAVAVTAAVLVILAWYLSVPFLVKHYLDGELGKRSFSDVVKAADAENRNALGKMTKAEILLDIPAEPITASLEDELQEAVSQADLGSGWKVLLLAKPEISFKPSVIQAIAFLELSNDDVGAAKVYVQLNIVPSILENELVAVPYVTAVSLSEVHVSGTKLPRWAAGQLNEAISKSLEALNTKVPRTRVAMQLPRELLENAKAAPALLVVNEAVAALLGKESGTVREITGAYSDEFTRAAKEILPSYVPGDGVIAVRPTDSPLTGVTDTMRDEAAAANLATLEAMLGIDRSIMPDELDASAVPLIAVAVEAQYFNHRLKELAVQAISEIDVQDVEVDVKPDNVSVELKEGVVEAIASGTATVAGGKLVINFSLTAWGVLSPGPEGLVASYAPREIKVTSVRVAWTDRGATLTVPYDTALGDVLAHFIERLPRSPLNIPNIPVNLVTGNQGNFKLNTREPSLLLNFAGRAVSLAPERISVFALASFEDEAAVMAQPAPLAGQLQRLTALSAVLHHTLIGGGESDSLSMAIPKAGFAKLLETTWVKLDPVLDITHQATNTFDAGEIKIIPGDASCGNPCKGVSECGDVLSCKVNVCQDVVVGQACHSLCPYIIGACRDICDEVTRRVCNDEDDSGCIAKIDNCVREATKCATAWGSGLQSSCELALSAIKLTDTTGIARLKGGIRFDGSGATAAGSRLAVAPDLRELSLAIDAGGRAGLDPWVDITWTDWGNLFLCPSGRLSLHVELAVRLATSPLNSTVTWQNDGDGLKGTFSFGKVSVLAEASEGLLGNLLKSNPSLLTCSLGQAIFGLTSSTLPRVTQEVIADSIRDATRDEKNAKIAAAVIDGRYQYEGEMPPVIFNVPPLDVALLDKTVRFRPRITESAIVMGTGALSSD